MPKTCKITQRPPKPTEKPTKKDFIDSGKEHERLIAEFISTMDDRATEAVAPIEKIFIISLAIKEKTIVYAVIKKIALVLEIIDFEITLKKGKSQFSTDELEAGVSLFL